MARPSPFAPAPVLGDEGPNDDIDLLHHEPVPWRAPEISEALTFALASGVGVASLRELGLHRPLAPSSFDADQFARDLFLEELVLRCMPVVVGGVEAPELSPLVLRVVARPPRDGATTRFRQAVLRELEAKPARAGDLEAFALSARRLRLLVSDDEQRFDMSRHRLAILRAFVDSAEAAARFAGSASGLGRLGALGRNILASAAFERVRSLLAYEDGAAAVDLSLRLGFDGRVRGLVVHRIESASHNEHHRSWLSRTWQKLGLFARGARFSDEEVLAQLLDDVSSAVLSPMRALLLASFDAAIYLAALSLRRGAERAGLSVSLAELDEGGPRTLVGLFNPLVAAGGVAAVPCHLHIDALQTIVTGPNSGGKTRLLQSLAFAQLLGQAGLFVPAAVASLPPATGIFASLRDEGSAGQAEGRLGTELARIRRLFERVDAGSLVLLDELCAGTNPDEGEAIFRVVTRLLADVRATAFVTTHFLAFATRLAEEARTAGSSDTAFRSVELDDEERPTFQFAHGVAATSLAHRTAARLGVTEDSLRELLRQRGVSMASPTEPSQRTASPDRVEASATTARPEVVGRVAKAPKGMRSRAL